MRTSRVALVPGKRPAHRGRGVVRSRPNAVRAGWIDSRRGAAIRWRQLLWTFLDAPKRRGASCKLHPRSFDVRPAAPHEAGRAFPEEHPHLTFRVTRKHRFAAPSAKSAHRPGRCRPFGFHLRVRTASRTPGEERALRTIQNAFRRERPSHGCPCESDSSWFPVKDTVRNLHTVSLCVRTAARVNATTISLELGTHALT